MTRRQTTGALATLGVLLSGVAACVPSAAAATPGLHRTVAAAPAGARWIVRSPGGTAAAADAVRRNGGRVLRNLDVIGAVEAVLPAQARAALAAAGCTLAPNVTVHAMGREGDGGQQASDGGNGGDSAAARDGSGSDGSGSDPVRSTAQQLAAMHLGAAGGPDGGAGIGVAVVDTGVADVAQLDGHLTSSPDLSGADGTGDGFGHGTFMAGLIAGDGSGTGGVPGSARGADVVSVKVARADGTTDMASVIAGIGWTIAHREDQHIRVLSLSLGADTGLPPSQDPLDAAVEAAWASGITVVAAAGNTAGTVTSPGNDPWVITVGAEGTSTPLTATSWSGSSGTKPDILAPGTSTISLRSPGSVIDTAHPSARVGESYFRGSGTSMATALVAGAVADLVANHPGATPDDLKGALLTGSGHTPGGPARPIDVAAADAATADGGWVQHAHLDFSYPGESTPDVMPWAQDPFTAVQWKAVQWKGSSWTAVQWKALQWKAVQWKGSSWSAVQWKGSSWSAVQWKDVRWDAVQWKAVQWKDSSWSDHGWS